LYDLISHGRSFDAKRAAKIARKKVSARGPRKMRQIDLPIWVYRWLPAQVLSPKKLEAEMDLKQKPAPVEFRSTLDG
jgi:hypothetical protein